MDSPAKQTSSSSESELNCGNSTADLLANSITGKSCTICLCAVEDRRAAVVIPCMHAYCISCIRKWSDLKRKCPLCNSDFDSWYFDVDLSSQSFQKEVLPPAPGKGKDVIFDDIYTTRRRRFIERQRSFLCMRRLIERQRLIRRSRAEFNALSSRTRPLPPQRSFGQQEDEHPEVIAGRALRWRASIYEQQLQAVPFSSTNSLTQQLMGNEVAKGILLRRIEPWIRRELHALLGDQDPTVIVHVVTSLFISNYQRWQQCPSGQLNVQNDFLAPLRTFLHEKTEIFWHELRCFAESSFSMETYDSVVKYNRLLK